MSEEISSRSSCVRRGFPVASRCLLADNLIESLRSHAVRERARQFAVFFMFQAGKQSHRSALSGLARMHSARRG